MVRRAFAPLAALVLLGATLATTGAAVEGEALAVPAFHVGDRADYNGSFDYSVVVAGSATMRLMDGTSAPLPTATTASKSFGLHDAREAWDPATGAILSQAFACSARDGAGSCLPYVAWEWSDAGLPAVLGMAALQGATVAPGETWTTPRVCGTCAAPVLFRVDAPAAESPSGTAFSVYVEDVRLDMPQGSPYALRVTVGVLHADLVKLERGEAPLDAGAPAPARLFPAVADAQPYVAGIPVEGTPIAGWHAWSEARNATGGAAPAGALVALSLSRGGTTSRVAGAQLDVSRDERILVDAAPVGDARHTQTTYAETEQLPDLMARLGVAPRWTAAQTSASGPAPQACDHRAIPLWDLVRLGAGGADLNLWRYDGLACGAETLAVSWPSPGPFENTTVVSAPTGLLVSWFTWTG